MNRRQILYIILIALFFGAVGSVVLNRFALPLLSSLPGLNWVSKLQSTSPIVITRREEVRLNEGVNLIELTKQAQTVVVSIYNPANQRILGNGLIIASDGVIFTSKEVVGASTNVTVVLNDGTVYPGLVRALDRKSPIAVITIAAKDLPVAEFSDASSMQTAQRVFALGTTNQEFTRTFASGLITKTLGNNLDPERVLSTENFELTLNTDADLGAEYIGGPIVNLQGRVVGLIINGTGSILPAEAVDGALKSYLESGKVARPYIGLNYLMITKNAARLKNLASGGAQVVAAEANSPAARAGLLPNDMIIQVNGQNVADSSLEQLLVSVNGEFRVTIRRGDEQRELTIIPEVR